jgi:lysophospholipase L1-like esterase
MRKTSAALAALAAGIAVTAAAAVTASAGGPPEVVAFGDSLTWGAGSGSTVTAGSCGPAGTGSEGDSYPAQLAALSGWTVVNQGICGDMVTAASVNDPVTAVARFRSLLAQYPAGTVFVVEEGINDVAAGVASNLIADGYESMFHDAAVAGDPVFITTITPGAWAAGSSQETCREQVNTWIRSTAASKGAAGIIETEHGVSGMWGGTSIAVRYRADGQTINPNASSPHLNPAGYAIVASAVYGGIVHPVATETVPYKTGKAG